MKREQLQAYRETLTALGRRLQGDVAEVQGDALRRTGGEASGSLSNAPLHPADLGTDAHEQEVALDLLANEKQILEEITAALARIDAGTYGRCQECDRDIPAGRLQAVPYTPYCVDCARAAQGDTPPGRVTG